MATYLQGVTDYIPQFQPFQPDLNFYGNVLQTKQTQYDTNWKALNKMYGQYFHADLTRDDNIKRKDDYLNNVEFQLKRVSQLDLSLEQNVNQATQIFKPFYEDKGLMKDMAWTKNFNNQYGMAQSYKGAYDDKQRAKYWDVGLREMDYMKDEFKTASASDAMSFGNVQYTPYVNTIKEAQKLAKDAGLSIETVDFSEDGRFIVKNKNGEQLIEPLQKLFESQLGADPGIQAVYKSQSYVNRKDYAYSNAAQFGGDKEKAEMKYLEDSFTVLKDRSVQRYNQLKDVSTAYDKKIKDLEKQKEEGKGTKETDDLLKAFKTNKDINDKVLSRAEQDNEMINGDQSKTVTTSTGFQNPYGDIKSLRYKVDNGMASLLMQKDLDEAANIFAYKDAKTDIDANPYAVLADKHKYSMQQISARNAGLERAARIRNAGDEKNMINKARLEAGTHRIDENGQVIPIEGLNDTFVIPNDKGSSTAAINLKEVSSKIARMRTDQYATPYLSNTVALIQRFVKQGTMTKAEASNILGYSRFKNISLDKFSEKLNGSNSYGFITSEIGTKDLAQIRNKMSTWISQNGQLSGFQGQEYDNYKQSAINFSDYTNYLKANKDWLKETGKIAENEVVRKFGEKARHLYDADGNLNTKEEYVNSLTKGANKSKSSDRNIKLIQLKDVSSKLSNIYDEYMTGSSKNLVERAAATKRAKSDPRVQELLEKRREIQKVIGGTNLVEINSVAQDYDEMVKEAGKVYSSNKISKTSNVLPGLDQLGEMSGAGLFTSGVTGTFVNPKAVHTKGNIQFGQLVRDIEKIDWGSTNKNRVTFDGISKTAFDKRAEEGFRNDAGISILNAIRAEMMKPKTKMGNFKIGVAPIAGGSVNKAAMIIYPDSEWLKGYVYNKNKDGDITTPGIISTEQYNLIMKNGISYIADSKELSNDLYTSSFNSPLASYVDYYGSYTYSDPANPNYKLQIEKNKIGTGDYNVSMNYPLWNPEEGKYEMITDYNNTTYHGNNLERIRKEFATDITPKINNHNIQSQNGKY
jgi:hypothetical protein